MVGFIMRMAYRSVETAWPLIRKVVMQATEEIIQRLREVT